MSSPSQCKAFLSQLVLVATTVCCSSTCGAQPFKDGKSQTPDSADVGSKRVFNEAEQARNLARCIDALRLALADSDASIRLLAARGIGDVGPSASSCTRALAVALFDKDLRVRIAACVSLAQIGASAEEAIPDLLIVLRSKHAVLRRKAAVALGVIRQRPNLAIPALAEALDDLDDGAPEEASVRTNAVRALGDFGTDARAAFPALLKAYKGTSDVSFRCAALASAVQTRCDEDQMVALLADILDRSKHFQEIVTAAVCIGAYGQKARHLVPRLMARFRAEKGLSPDDDTLKRAIITSLRLYADHGVNVDEQLIAICSDNELPTQMRIHAFNSFNLRTSKSDDAVVFLVNCLTQSTCKDYHFSVIQSLRSSPARACSALLEAYPRTPADRKGPLIDAFGALELAATKAIPLLEKDSGDAKLRSRITAAIRRIKLKATD